jgi:bacillithiol biosynthesis cysteine-adding enzyme BshC
MRLHQVALTDTHQFSPFFIDYTQQKEQLREFYHHFPTAENLFKQAKEKAASYPSEHRAMLQEVLLEQYSTVRLTPTIKHCIELLGDEKTFTVTTGHQLNIFTGPLFFIFKIVTVVNACKRLKIKYPDYNFIPVYWMASEDHDYEEIKSFRLYGKKYTWETNQTGAVGHFSTADISKLLDEIPGDISIFRNAYLKQKNLAAAVRSYVNDLFSADGLLVLDGDHPKLKAKFRDVITSDLFDHTPSKLVGEKTAQLNALGYHTQVHARDINFFYLHGTTRSRIERDEAGFKVVDTDLRFSEDEIRTMIKNSPERFSPNVVLRPLYQEILLPNIAYVGGPAEVIYWLQLKSMFDHFNVPFPAIMPRNFGLIMEGQHLEKWKKTGFNLLDLFKEDNFLYNTWVLSHSKNDLTVGKELNAVSSSFEDLKKRASSIDKTLGPMVAAEATRVIHALEKIEKKMLRAEKKMHADRLRQIKDVKEAVFPGGSLQERTDNFLNFHQKDSEFISRLLSTFDPFDFRFNVMCYE